MSKTIATAPTIKKRKGYLIPIEGSELEGEIIKGSKYVRIRKAKSSKSRHSYSPIYYKKVKFCSCVYCGQEARYCAIFPSSGHDIIERLCLDCVKIHGPIADSAIDSNTVPACNLL